MQLDVARDKGGDKLSIRRRTSTATPDRVADVVDLSNVPLVSHAARNRRAPSPLRYLFAVFVCDNLACGRASVGTEHNPIFKEAANDSSTGAGGLWHLHALTREESIAIGTK